MQGKVLAYYTLFVGDLDFTTPCWSATSSLLHLNQFWEGGGGLRPPCPPPQYANGLAPLKYLTI